MRTKYDSNVLLFFILGNAALHKEGDIRLLEVIFVTTDMDRC